MFLSKENMENHNIHQEQAISVTKPKSSLLATVAICFAVLAVVSLSVFIFKFPLSSILSLGFLLACPLLHIFMMKGGNHKH